MGVTTWTEEHQRKAEALRAKGMSYRAIARELGMSATPVRRYLIEGERDRQNEAVRSHYSRNASKVLAATNAYKRNNRQGLLVYHREYNEKNQERRIWEKMISRCTNPVDPAFAWYGAKGIGVCQRWLLSHEAFVADMGPRPSRRHSVDRINTLSGYSPENCRWATPKVQANNKTTTRAVEISGEKVTLSELSEKYGIPAKIIYARLRHGWSVSDALTTEYRPGGRSRRNGNELRTQAMGYLYPRPGANPR